MAYFVIITANLIFTPHHNKCSKELGWSSNRLAYIGWGLAVLSKSNQGIDFGAFLDELK